MKMSRGGYSGEILDIDLTDRKVKKHNTTELIDLNLFIGGKGLASYILWKELKPKINPYSPENILVFATGPLTGTLCPGTRMCIAAKSPLTGLFCDSYIGGHFGAEIKFAGYDAIIIRGKSENLVYLYVSDDDVEFCDAKHLAGLDTFKTEDRIRREKEDKSIRIACIGPAGENLVRFAHINTERYRQAGRGGLGAVMGSKNLKAVAIKGTKPVELYDAESFVRIAKETIRKVLENETVKARRRWGTARVLLYTNDIGLLPTRNFKEATFEKAEEISAETLEKKFWVKHKACHSCPVNCGKLGVVKTGKYAGTVVEGIEYETLALIGANCGIGDYEVIAYANMLCDALGLDTISTGNVIAFAMECFEKGIIKKHEADGLELKFGNTETLIQLIRKIALREGLGDFLAEGVKKISEKLGKESEKFAMHVKGLELPGYDPRASPGMSLAYVTADRGGCHTRSWPVSYEVKGKAPDGTVIDRFSVEKRAEIVIMQQNRAAACDTLVACWFVRTAVNDELYVKMLNAATGMQFGVEEFLRVGERIWNLVRMFNLRESLQKEDERLPERVFVDAIPSGMTKDQRLEKKQLAYMLSEYYMLRGWNENGVPNEEKLKELGLEVFSNRRQ